MYRIGKGILGLALLLSSFTLHSETNDQHTTTNSEPGSSTPYELYKNPNCGCCVKWQQHLADGGYTATVRQPGNLNEIKLKLGVEPQHQSCHTAVFESGYIFEGHVPVTYIHQFLESPPADALGLTVPGMPLGSPGMEVNDQFQPYDILLLKKNGDVEVYASITDSAQQYSE